ncbi:MAG: carbamoyl phosphate synthase, partial [Clostridiales bacterium]|nr:carbamoyl phosphate synthase [Clostridiales bacterium]
MNILITSVGRRTRLLEYFKKELNGLGKLIAADCDILAPALYTAD